MNQNVLFKFFAFLALILSVGLTVNGCKEEKKSTPIEKTTLIMATSADNPPFEFHETGSGKDIIVGLDIDVAKALEQELKVKIDIHDMDFSVIIPALQTGRADLAMATMTPTEERKQNLSFSEDYFIARTAIVSLKGTSFSTEKALEGKKMGAQLGSTHEQMLKVIASKYKMDMVSLNKIGELVQEVKSGRLDGVLMEILPAKAFVKGNSDLSLSLLEDHFSSFAIAFPKNSHWIPKVNDALKILKTRGALEKIIKKWLQE